jgi:phosphatidylglycerophosphate synthase
MVFVTMSMLLTMRRAVTLLTIPNILTSSRAVLAVWFALAAPHVSSSLVLPVLFYGVFTDLADGFLARLLRCQTEFGAKLDPWCDAVFVVGLMIYLIRVAGLGFLPLVALLVRYLVIALYHYDLLLKGHDRLASVWSGKCSSGMVMALLVYYVAYVNYVRFSLLDQCAPVVVVAAILVLLLSWYHYYMRYLRLIHIPSQSSF